MTLLIALCTSSAWAQSIVSVGTNLDFSEGTPVDNGICTYAKDIESNGTTYSQMLEVSGWTIEGENGDARAAGLFAYGSGHWLGGKGYNVPATNSVGVAEGNALGIVAVWNATAQYTQPVTLEAGDYVISVAVYNAVGGTTAPTKSLIGFIADNGTEYLAPAKAYAVDTWTVENIKFTLSEATTGKLSLGYAAPNTGSGGNQHLFFDKVEIMAVTEADLARIDLNAALVTAQAVVDAKAGVGAGIFMYSEEAYNAYAAAVAAAKAVSENAEATKDELVAALAALNTATEAYVVTVPAADAIYAVKFNGTENYLTIGESAITIDVAADTLSFEAVGNGKYYVHDNKGMYLSYKGSDKWTMVASADVKDEWNISVNAEGLYTFVGKNGGIGVDGTEAGSSCYGDKNGAAVALWAIAEIVIEEEPVVDPNDYTSYIVNADLSTTDAWNAEGTKGIKDGMVKVGSQAVYDFSQTITLPAGQYKMTAKAVYRYGSDEQAEYDAIVAGTETHKTKLYAETATYKYEADVQNRYDGASDTDYAGSGTVTINGKYVPNSSAAVQAWFNAGQYVNELVFNVQEDGQIKIGITTVDGIAGDYGNIGAWTLTRLGDAEADPEEEPIEPVTPAAPALDGTYFSVAAATSTLEYEKWYLLKSQGRNAYINELGTELRMKGAGELAAINATDDNKGLFFKLGKGTAEGTYTIVSGNGNYFTIAGSSSAVSATAVDYIIGNVAEGVFYMQDPASSVVADANAAGGTFVGWGTTVPTSAGGNNCYQFMEVEFIDAAAAEAIVKASSMLYDLQVAYGLVTDASKFSSNAPETSEGSLGALIDNNYGTFFHSAWSYTVEGAHHLQMEVSEPTESLFFYFKKRSQNNNNRPTDITIFGSNDGENFVEITNLNSGFPTDAAVVDYTSEIITASEAYKHFRFVVNATSNATAFFTFSEFYLFPGNQTIIDAIVSSKALIEAGIGAENFDELKANFEAAYNKVQEDKFNKVFNTAIADAEAILAAASHAEVPALGQYSTAGYTEFEATLAALKNEATQENLEAINVAVAKFEATKCLPVFTINGVIDYAAGKSIYENAEGGLNFKLTDLADETMLWAFDMTETVVGVTEKVVVKNLATGNLFWGAPSIKVAETSEAIAEDGIFLFYTEGNGTEVHAQNNNQVVVRWADKAATSGSAWTFTYVGTTYDIYDVAQAAWVNVSNDYMVSADLSSESGWTAAGVDDHGAEAHKFLAFYAGWGELEQPTTASLKQEVTLPAGEYRLTGKAYFRQGENAATNPEKSLGYMVAGDNKVLVPALGSIEAGLSVGSFETAADAFYNKDLFTCVLEFTLEETTTLSIGYECDFDEMRSWMGLGSMKLERNVTPAAKFLDQYAAYEMLQAQYTSLYMLNGVMNRWSVIQEAAWALKSALENGEKVLRAKLDASMAAMAAMTVDVKAIDEYYNNVFTPLNDLCFATQENSTPNSDDVYAAFDEACMLGGFMNLYSNVATLEDLQGIVAAMEAGRREYVLNAVPAEGFTFDYTFLIAGVGDSADGWVKNIDGFSGNFVYKVSAEKDTETLKKTGFIEAWNPSAYNGSISYTANELPNGYYKVSAYAFTNGGTSFFANDKSAVVENTSMYVQPIVDSVLVIDGTLQFGLNVENANWVGITNVELAYMASGPCKKTYDVVLEDVKVTDWAVETVISAEEMAEIVELLGAPASELTFQLVDTTGVHTNYNGNPGEVLFWVDLEGNASAWGVNNKFFLSYDSVAQTITSTQYAVAEGDVLNATVRLANAEGDYVVVKLTESIFVSPIINIADFEVVSTITVKHVEPTGVIYSAATASFDPISTASALGVASLDEAEQYILNVTTGNLVANTTDGWRDAHGDAANWGAEGGVCVKIQQPSSGSIDYIGCIDTTHEHGEVYTAKWAFVHEGKAVVIEVVIIFETDGIENIEAIQNAVIYTISGKRVQGDVDSLERGIYIVNGKKVFVK